VHGGTFQNGINPGILNEVLNAEPPSLIVLRTGSTKDDEEVIRKIDLLMKDPDKWDEYIASRVERVLKHWPKR
jgi:hypothetical protein